MSDKVSDDRSKTPAAGATPGAAADAGDAPRRDEPRALVSPYRQALLDDLKGEPDPAERRSAKAAAPEGGDTLEGGDSAAVGDDTLEGAEKTGAEGEGDDSIGGGAETVEGGEEAFIADFAELAAQQGWDPEWIDGLQVAVKIDGRDGKASFKDVVASYQTLEAAKSRLAEAEAGKTKANKDIQERAKGLDESYAVAAKLIQSAEQVLDDDVANIDWAKLRAQDPAEYAAKKEDIKERRERIQALKDQAVDDYRTAAEKLRQPPDPKALEERVAKVESYIVEKLPEWRDPKAAEKGTAEVTAYLAADGFTPEQIRNGAVQDPRLLVYAEKARRLDALEAKAGAVQKRVAAVPKVAKPGPKAGDRRQEKPLEELDMDDYVKARKKQGAAVR